jgi:HEAT repeat protein
MQITFVTVAIVVAIVVVGVIAFLFLSGELPDVPDDISDDEIQQMVDRLFVQKDESNFERLKLVGPKAVSMLIALLDNPKTASTRFLDCKHVLDARSPFERIVELLDPIGPAEAARSLANYIDHEDDHFRKYAAMALGNIGTLECVAAMLKALDDPDDYVRSYAMTGIHRGIKSKRCSKEFLDAMFPALTNLLNRHDSTVSGSVPKLLLEIDMERALPVLLSTTYFAIDNEEVHHFIRALNASGYKIPHDTLLPFLKTTKPLVDKHPYGYVYAEALRAYANNPDVSAEQLFRIEETSSSKQVKEAAANALTILSGVSNARAFVFDALKAQGFDYLIPHLKHYYAVFIYDAEVKNGGHSQYFVNSSGNQWRSALEGLNAIGAKARAAILTEAAALFGPAGPSIDTSPRTRQLARFSEQQEKSLSELDTKYYSCNESVNALLDQYAITHKQHFTANR